MKDPADDQEQSKGNEPTDKQPSVQGNPSDSSNKQGGKPLGNVPENPENEVSIEISNKEPGKVVPPDRIAKSGIGRTIGKWIWRICRICILLILAVSIPSVIFVASPLVRASLSEAFWNLGAAGSDRVARSCTLLNPSTLTTKERFSLHLQSDGRSDYELKIYQKDYKDFSQLTDRLDADFLRLSPFPPVTVEQAFLALWSKPAVYEHKGEFHFVDFDQTQAVDRMETSLPPGDYVYLVEQTCYNSKSVKHLEHQTGAFRVSDLGLIVKEAADKAIVKVIDLNTLAPVSAARIEMFLLDPQLHKAEKKLEAVTGSDGLKEVAVTLALNSYLNKPLWTATYGQNTACNWDQFYPGNNPYDNWKGSTMEPNHCSHGSDNFPASIDCRNTYIVSDRSAYRLGQEVFLKGITRLISPKGLVNPGANQNVDVTIYDPDNHEQSKLKIKTGQFGDFDFRFSVPDSGKTGTYTASVKFSDGDYVSKSVEVIQYRKPEFLVELVPDAEHTVAGQKLKAKLKAKYFFGGPVKNAKVEYRVRSGTNYQARDKLKDVPPYLSFYTDELRKSNSSNYYSYSDNSVNVTGTAVTNDAGEADLNIQTTRTDENGTSPFDPGFLERDYVVSATVTDLSRKVVEGSGSALVTPSDVALILNSSTRVISAGQQIKASVQATDYDNHPISGQNIKVTLEHWDYNYSSNKYERENQVLDIAVNSGKDGIASIDLPVDKTTPGGRYFLRVESADKTGHKCRDFCEIWLEGEDMANDQEDNPGIQIRTDKDVYKPGEKIRALIQLAPSKGSQRTSGLATVERRTIHSFQNLDFDGRQKLIEIPVEESYAPNVFLSVCTINSAHQFSSQEKLIYVYPEHSILNLSVESNKSRYEPGQEVTVKVRATHQDGKPASNTELTVSVADESIFSIRPDDTADISHNFYCPDRDWIRTLISFSEKMKAVDNPPALVDFKSFTDAWTYISNQYNYASTISSPQSENSQAFASNFRGGANSTDAYYPNYGTIGPQAGDATVVQGVNTAGSVRSNSLSISLPFAFHKSEQAAPPPPSGAFPKEIVLRKDFHDTAFWSPSVVTDKDGVATLKIKMPDNLTTWRTALKAISQATDTGSGSMNLTVSKDVLARLSLPRFFTEDDQGIITGIVHNNTDKQQKIDMELTTPKSLQLGAPARQILDLPSAGVGRFTWPVHVLDAGKAEITLKAAGDKAGDGVVEKIPVRSFCYPAFACKNGVLQGDHDSIQLPLKQTKDAKPGSAKFTISMSSSAIGPVLGNFDKLIDYPYGCTEQTMSRMVPSIVAMQLHKRLGVPLSDDSKELFRKSYHQGLITIISYQNSDGAWGWWAGDRSNVYLTSYVLEGLYLLRQSGFTCDQSLIDAGKHALESMTSGLLQPKWERETATDHAYALYVMSLFGSKPSDIAMYYQMNNLRTLSPEGLSYLTLALHRAGIEQQAKAAYERLLYLSNKSWELTDWDHNSDLFKKMSITDGFDYSYRFTGAESTALALRSVIAMEPKNEKLQSSIRRWILLQHDQNGWTNTKTTAMVFLALLEDEINASEGKATNFRAEAVVGGQTLASLLFNEKNHYAAENTIDFALKSSDEFIDIRKNGSGRLYYNSLLRYDRPIKPGSTVVPRSSPPDLLVERKFYKLQPYLDEKTKDRRTRAVPLTAAGVSSGETILMKLSITSPVAVPYVIVEAALPSGAEVVSQQRTIDPLPSEPDESDFCLFSFWWTHQDVLDDRIVFFVTSMPAGKSAFQALLRMEMPGKFNVVPVSMEGMYSKAIRGYSAADQVNVMESK